MESAEAFRIACVNALWTHILLAQSSRAGVLTCLLGLTCTVRTLRWPYVIYIMATLCVLTHYVYGAVLEYLANSESSDALASMIFIAASTAPALYCAARLGGTLWIASRVGAACSFASFVEASAFLLLGVQQTPSVVVSSFFELFDCLLGIPMFLFKWKSLIRVHAVWGLVSTAMLLVSADASLKADQVLCRHVICTDRVLESMGVLTSLTVVSSVTDLVCSLILLFEHEEPPQKECVV